MAEIIALILLIFSLIGMGVILFGKIPILLELPETKSSLNFKINISSKVKKIPPFKKFSIEFFLQKILSKIRILTLKTDYQTFHWLLKLREKSKRKKEEELDDYWQKIRRMTKKRRV